MLILRVLIFRGQLAPAGVFALDLGQPVQFSKQAAQAQLEAADPLAVRAVGFSGALPLPAFQARYFALLVAFPPVVARIPPLLSEIIGLFSRQDANPSYMAAIAARKAEGLALLHY